MLRVLYVDDEHDLDPLGPFPVEDMVKVVKRRGLIVLAARVHAEKGSGAVSLVRLLIQLDAARAAPLHATGVAPLFRPRVHLPAAHPVLLRS